MNIFQKLFSSSQKTISINSNVSIIEHGGETLITVNGKKVDPASPEGKKILKNVQASMKHVDTAMEHLETGMEAMGKSLSKMGEELSKIKI